MIVLDASVLIAFLDSDDTHHAAAEQLLTQAVDDDLAVNSLTLAEVLVAPVVITGWTRSWRRFTPSKCRN